MSLAEHHVLVQLVLEVPLSTKCAWYPNANKLSLDKLNLHTLLSTIAIKQ